MEAVRHRHTIPDILVNLVRLINDLQQKNASMINHYIYPDPIPTEIAAYEPRLLILKARIQNLSQLSLTHLSTMIDDAVSLVASYICSNISQLAASSVGIQKIFINHYDRGLAKSVPYDSIHSRFIHYAELLHEFLTTQMESPNRQAAEELVLPPSPKLPSLCHGAIAFMNQRDDGRISSVTEKDLLPPHRDWLTDQGGVVLWWECPVCAFRLQYHASDSVRLNVNQTDEIMIEDDTLKIAYRSAWLVKCHIYHPHLPSPVISSPPTSPAFDFSDWELPPLSPVSPEPKKRNQSTQKRVSFTRRKSSSSSSNPTNIPSDNLKQKHRRTTSYASTARIRTISPSPPPPAPFPPSPPLTRIPSSRTKPTANTSTKILPPLSKLKSNSKTKPTPDPTGPSGLRYFCPFCIAKGKPLTGHQAPSSPRFRIPSPPSSILDDNEIEPTCFENSRDFMEHIDDRHTRDRPASLLLLGLKVAVNGEMAPGPERGRARWDLDLRT